MKTCATSWIASTCPASKNVAAAWIMNSTSKKFSRSASASVWRSRECCSRPRATFCWMKQPARSTAENEESLYEELASTSATIVSVTHHPALVKYHSQILELKPGGEWSVYPASKFRASETLEPIS